MPFLSAFTPFGLLDCSSEVPAAEQIYEALKNAYGIGYVVKDGTHMGARCYALAMMFARLASELERGANQRDPLLTTEMMPALERQYRVAVRPSDTRYWRRRLLAAKYLAAKGATPQNVLLALTTLLGSDLIAIYSPAEDGTYIAEPTDPSSGPGLFMRDDFVEKRFSLIDPVATLGTPVTFRYSPRVPKERLVVGERAVVQYGNWAVSEVVTIAFVAEGSPYPVASATFTKPKDVGASIRVGPVPYETSSARHTLIVVTPSAARDPVVRGKIHDVMSLIATGVSTWGIVEPSNDATRTAGPFTLGVSYLGATPLGTVTY